MQLVTGSPMVVFVLPYVVKNCQKLSLKIWRHYFWTVFFRYNLAKKQAIDLKFGM